MSAAQPCGSADCPVPPPEPSLLRHLRTTLVPAGTTWHRGVAVMHPDATVLVAGRGDSRFAPLEGTSHVYLASNAFAALLESAFHDATPPEPRIYQPQLARWIEAVVATTVEVRLIDLRDTELVRLGIAREGLVATEPTHYSCTRLWADALHGRVVGGRQTHGLLWQSRQTELHAAALGSRPALSELIAELPAEVAVIWSPPVASDLLTDTSHGLGPLDGIDAADFVDDVIALLGIIVE